MNNDFSIPPISSSDTLTAMQAAARRAWYNRANQQVTAVTPPPTAGFTSTSTPTTATGITLTNSTDTFNTIGQPQHTQPLLHLATQTALPPSVSFSDMVYVYNKVLPPDGSTLSFQDLAKVDFNKLGLNTTEAIILGALMGNESLFKLVDTMTPSTVTTIAEGSQPNQGGTVFRKSPSIALASGGIVPAESAFSASGAVGSIATAKGTPQQPTQPQPLVAQLPNKTVTSFVPTLGATPVVNNNRANQLPPTTEVGNNNTSLFALTTNRLNTSVTNTPLNNTTPTDTPIANNLQRWFNFLLQLPPTISLQQRAFQLLLLAQLYGHLPLELPETRGETRDEALQRLSKIKDEQTATAEAKAKRNPFDQIIEPLEALVPVWLLDAIQNVGMVDKKGAIHLKSAVLTNLYVRARNQFGHEDIKFEELLTLKPTNRDEARHLKFLKDAEVFNLLAHMERGGDDKCLNLQDLKVATDRHILHTHFGYNDDETIIIDTEE